MTPAVVVDCDPGHEVPGANVDDALALALLLCSSEVALAGVTVTAGNVDVAAGVAGARSLLALAGRRDVPVVAGAPDSGRAAAFLGQQVRAAPGGTTVLSLGPPRNLAAAVDADPAFARDAARIVLMGGFLDPALDRESNFAAAPAAADRVLACGVDLTVVPLDVTQTTGFGPADVQRLRAVAADPLARRVAEVAQRWLGEVQVTRGLAGFPLHDPLAAALLVDPAVAETTALPLRVDAGREPGRLVPAEGRRAVTVVRAARNHRLVELLVRRVGGVGARH